ncbi:hypothetical protein GF325_10375 [Candidatus Bathyarchaeota archaeon]|nr:hypothetical protein [Candidatus Bathyarchaeota archaeon]
MSPFWKKKKEEPHEEFVKKVAKEPFKPHIVKGGNVGETQFREEFLKFARNLSRLDAAGLRARMAKMQFCSLNLSLISRHLRQYGKIPPVPEGIEEKGADEQIEMARKHISDGKVDVLENQILGGKLSWEPLSALYSAYKVLINRLPEALMMEDQAETMKSELRDWAEKGGDLDHDFAARMYMLKHVIESVDAAVENRPLPELETRPITIEEMKGLREKIPETLKKFSKLSDQERHQVVEKFTRMASQMR